jgi:hypothetical protein
MGGGIGGGFGGIGGAIGKIDIEGIGKRIAADSAKSNFDKVSKDALSDGRVSDKERRQIDGAGRDWKIAEKKVDLHDATKAHKQAVDQALNDGRMTPAEQKRINDAQTKVDTLQKQLKGMETEDRMKDVGDALADFKPGGGLRPPTVPDFKLPDFKLPDFKLPDLTPGGSRLPFNPSDMCRPPRDLPADFRFPSVPQFPRPPVFDFSPLRF